MSSIAAGARSTIEFFVNHRRHSAAGPDAFLPLSTYLRERKGLTGTKVVCEEGDCGACTVLLGWLGADGRLEYRVVDACIQFVFQLDGCHVITVEGLSADGALHRVQTAMIEHFGSQCGFCTPGFVMAMADLAEKHERFDEGMIKEKLTGNLCRCTGYEPIIKACLSLNENRGARVTALFDRDAITAELRRTREEAVLVRSAGDDTGDASGVPAKTFFRPRTLQEALDFLDEHPGTRIVAGATDLGVQINKGRSDPDRLMFVAHLHEIAGIEKRGDAVLVGAAANWSEIQAGLGDEFPELRGILEVFASEQIKNAATIGGNIANASPIADSLPLLFVLEAVLVLKSSKGERRVPIRDFYKGYKTLDLQAGEMIVAVELPRPGADRVLRLYKISKRKDLDISTFTAGVLLTLREGTIQDARLAYGGVGPVVLRLPNTENFLRGKPWDEATMAAAGDVARTEITPISDVRASRDYRLTLARNILLKFYHEIAGETKAAV